MRAVFSAWLTSGILAVMALLALKALAPAAGEGGPVDEYAQVLRVHLPWLLSCVLMAVAAGSYVRDRVTGFGRALAALPAPVLGALAAAFIGVPWSGTPVGLTLHLIEAVLGVILGLALSTALSRREETGGAHTREHGQWRRDRR
ncbi:hypothetical protein [Actinomadura livida]|nr:MULTISPECIES: hypothetical protein [Actinomadura]MBB4773302.1 putative membrane protein YcfT [Actinomadura catellatispora]